MVKIITLSSWGGEDFNHPAGGEVDVTAAVAAERVAEGVAAYVPGQEPAPQKKATKERAGSTVETTSVEPSAERR